MNNSTAYKLAQLPANSLRVGIDPHKRQHTVVIRTAHAQILSQFRISNDRPGFETLRRRCEQFRQHAGADQVIYALEPGAHYWRNLAYYLHAQGDTFRLVNPLTLKRQRDGDDLTHRKNDYRDAAMAADLLGQGKYTWTRLPEGVYAELRQAHETYQRLVTETARVKLHLTTALDGLFPEFFQVFKSVEGRTALTVLRTCPNPEVIQTLTEAALVERLHAQHGAPRFMQAKVRALHARAARTIGLRAGATALTAEVQLLADRLTFLLHQRRQAEERLLGLLRQIPESALLLSIRGLGPVNAAGILAHIGDIRQYSGVKQLTKLAGLVPMEDRSAERRAARTPMSKKGRRGLRGVLWRAVVGLVRHNALFAAYVKRLCTRQAHAHPLHRREAWGAAMNKLLRIVYALLSKGEPFDPAYGTGG
jgi:transposase